MLFKIYQASVSYAAGVFMYPIVAKSKPVRPSERQMIFIIRVISVLLM